MNIKTKQYSNRANNDNNDTNISNNDNSNTYGTITTNDIDMKPLKLLSIYGAFHL